MILLASIEPVIKPSFDTGYWTPYITLCFDKMVIFFGRNMRHNLDIQMKVLLLGAVTWSSITETAGDVL